MVEVTRPYMHNGAFATLEEVVDFYDQGGDADLSGTSTKSALIQPLNLTQAEKDLDNTAAPAVHPAPHPRPWIFAAISW